NFNGRSSLRVSGQSVRHGAKYISSGLESVLGSRYGAGGSMSAAFGRTVGGSGLSRVLGVSGYRSGMGGGGLSMSGTAGLPVSLRGVEAAKALHTITSAFRTRVGGRDINVGGYGINYSFLPSTAGPSFGGPFGGPLGSPLGGPLGPGYIDPATLPSPDTVQHTRIQEKQDLQALNNKFANLVDQVRSLEQHNAILKSHISVITNPNDPEAPINTAIVASTITASYNSQIEDLRTIQAALTAEIDHLTSIIEDFTCKYTDEVEITKTLETQWNTFKEDIDETYVTIVDMQTKVQGVETQIDTNKQIYNARMREMHTVITDGPTAAYSITVDNTNQALDLATSVQEVKSHYEILATKSREEAFTQVQPRIVEMEAQITDKETLLHCQTEEWTEKINSLRFEMEKIKKLITQYAREYQDLLATKMSLDVEISAYRKLLDSEETRIRHGGGITITTNAGTFPGGLSAAPGGGVSYAMAPAGVGGVGLAGFGGYGFRSMGGGGGVGFAAGGAGVGYGAGGVGMGMSLSRMSMGAVVGGGSYGSGYSAGVGPSSSCAGFSTSRKSHSSGLCQQSYPSHIR
uniref:Si:dkey-183i3.5 n=1 Tax=Eptatretus burgeri TaxID=7764 RepID=A0A8C4RA89_EPTBU